MVIEAAAEAGTIPSRVPQWLRDPGLDVCQDDVRQLLPQLVDGDAITTEAVGTLLALGDATRPRWPRLQPGHVQDALRRF